MIQSIFEMKLQFSVTTRKWKCTDSEQSNLTHIGRLLLMQESSYRPHILSIRDTRSLAALWLWPLIPNLDGA